MEKASTSRRNILWITFDHQLFYRHTDGAKSRIKRPVFDSFCADSVSFDNAFSVCPLCVPARRSMLNGQYPHNHGTLTNDNPKPVDETTYFDLASAEGYSHYYFGKWHTAPGTAQSLGAGGFSCEGYGSPYLHQDYKDYLKRYDLPPPRARVEFSETERDFFVEGETVELSEVKNLYSYTFGELISKKETHECFYLANRACETLRTLKSLNSDKPFMLRLDFWGPHHPYFPTEEFLNIYDEDEIPIYESFYDTLENKPPIYRFEVAHSLSKDNELIIPNPVDEASWKKMLKYAYAQNTMCDEAVGNVINCLKELGLYENTVIVWTADHGDALCSHGGHIDKNCYLSEEVIRIPLAIRNPFSHVRGKIVSSLVSNLDIPVTIADFIRGGFNSKTDGISLKGYTENVQPVLEREYFVAESHGHFQKHIARAVVWKNYRFILNKNMIDELYDLNSDPYQLTNLINNNEYNEIKQKLYNFLQDWKKEYNDREI